MLALGLKKVLEYVSDTDHHDLSDPLKSVALTALVLGVVLYLLAQVAFIARTSRLVRVHRIAIAVILLSLIAIGPHIPALATLAIITTVVALMVGYESVRFADERDQIRHRSNNG